MYWIFYVRLLFCANVCAIQNISCLWRMAGTQIWWRRDAATQQIQRLLFS
jgi:hypothetical protein